jgi:hypothetical protein
MEDDCSSSRLNRTVDLNHTWLHQMMHCFGAVHHDLQPANVQCERFVHQQKNLGAAICRTTSMLLSANTEKVGAELPG